ncbi:MAG: nicotinate (nicotinamide) nucleotide adenylyltransferase [Planctomycetota bacterium]|nr:MAG: nicotinate (nicotinamide) nucleotide adenylyltransferase [Planctomycetota bacterium]
MAERKVALFGGTFDPIHLGHTAVAGAAAAHIGADKIIFIPAKCSPLKDSLPSASDDDRLAMIALAIADNKKFQLDDYELKKKEASYTLETVRRFQAQFGSDTSLYWLVGADSVGELQYWYRIAELIDVCNLCVMYRAGYKPPDFIRFESIWGSDCVEKLQRNVIQTPLIDISSTEIRNRLAAGLDVSDKLTPRVADYIHKHGLYQSEAEY